MEVGADGQVVHEQAEEPVEGEEGGVHPMVVWGGWLAVWRMEAHLGGPTAQAASRRPAL